jgi:hypothetical protein
MGWWLRRRVGYEPFMNDAPKWDGRKSVSDPASEHDARGGALRPESEHATVSWDDGTRAKPSRFSRFVEFVSDLFGSVR